MHFTCRSFIGKTNIRFWSQSWENEPDDVNLVSQKGHLFGLVTVQSEDDDSDLNIIGRSIIEDFTTSYYSSPGSISDAIIASAKSINLPQERDLIFSLQICVVNFPEVYLFNTTEDKVFIVRQSNFSNLLDGPSAKVLSGSLELEDKLFLVSKKFADSITIENLTNNLSGSVNEIEENFSSHLFSLPNQNGFSALFIQVQPDEEVVDHVDEIAPEEPEVAEILEVPTITPFLAPVSSPQYVTHSESHETVSRKKISLVVATILIILLTVSVVFSFRRNQATKLETNYQSLKTSLDQKITDATTVKSLNIEASLKAAEEAKGILNQLMALKVHSGELGTYSDQITQLLSQTGSVNTFPGTEIYDTSLIIKNPRYVSIFLSKTKLSLLDNQTGRIDELDLGNKSYRNMSVSESLKNASKLIVDQNNLYVSSSNSLYQISSDKVTKSINFNTDQNNLTVSDIAVWNGSFYVLTPDSIYKLSQNPDAFTAPKPWLKDNQSLPMGVTSIAINGRIWVLSKTGVIAPYNLGQKESFKPSSELQLTNARRLITSIDKDVLVFLDGDSMIYAYNKDGTSLAKFNFGDKKILDIAYDEDLNKIYALCVDQKIYSIDL